MRKLILAALIAAAPAGLAAQTVSVPMPAITGTRLDVVASGEVARVPDIAHITAGVVTSAPTATAALAENARRMASVRAALRQAGIEDRDIRTSAINLFPDYRHDERGMGTPQLIGYRASNEVTVRFRDIANAGRILDALVAQGANQISGPMLAIDKPETALDEARTKALAAARQRAELYARATGKKVGRILSISEGGGIGIPYARMGMVRGEAADASTQIAPGEQTLAVTLSVSFELE